MEKSGDNYPGVYVLGGGCPGVRRERFGEGGGGTCPGGKCAGGGGLSGGICPRGKCSGGKCPGLTRLPPYVLNG